MADVVLTNHEEVLLKAHCRVARSPSTCPPTQSWNDVDRQTSGGIGVAADAEDWVRAWMMWRTALEEAHLPEFGHDRAEAMTAAVAAFVARQS